MRILYSHRIRSRDGQAVHLEAMVEALRAAGHEVLVSGPEAFAQTALGGGSAGLDALRRRLPGWLGELAELAYALPATWRLDRAARAFRPDVIYERANLFHFAGICVARWRGLPLLLEVNSPLAEERAQHGRLSLRRLAGAAERLVWRRASHVLPVTEVLAGHLRAAGVPDARISVIPNGINPAEFPPASVRGASPGVTLGFIGFLREWHGMDRVLDAMAREAGARDLTLRIVGDGPALPALRAQAAALGIGARVTFLGLASRAEAPGLIAGFDIALQPAAVAYACPLKILEYMAAGCAIVAPDQPNLRELLEDGRTALLFDPADPEAMWRAILALAGDAALRTRLGEAARAEIGRRGLSWAALAARVVALAQEARPR